MATPRTFRVPEKAVVPLNFTNTEGQSTAALTVTVKAIHPTTGVAYTLGSGAGAATGTDFSITCNFSALPTTGLRYELWAAADIAGANPVTVIPNALTAERVFVEYYDNPIY